MFINDKIIFLQLQKTASTHIADVLNRVMPGEFRAKHSQLTEKPGDRIVIGSVRNPWDWYVSLWAYGCQAKGAIYAQLTLPFPQIAYRLFRQSMLHLGDWPSATKKIVNHRQKNHADWQGLYASSDDVSLFRDWLRMLLSTKGKRLLMEEYPHLPLRNFAGLLTFRFLRIFVDYRVWQTHAHLIDCQSGIETCYRQHGIVDYFIRTEHLEDDLMNILKHLDIYYDPAEIACSKKSNASNHRGSHLYYDNETIELVRAQERLLIEEFGYKPPIATGDTE